jgi:hypothetical protein
LTEHTDLLWLNTLQVQYSDLEEQSMWWMLLIAVEMQQYRAEIVYSTTAQCEAAKTQPEDLCVPVTVEFIHSELDVAA